MSDFGVPQLVAAVIVSLLGLLVLVIFLQIKTGQISNSVRFGACVSWCVFLFFVWGLAGYFSDQPFILSGFTPVELFIRSLPVILKAL